jgi:two-component system response regulator
MVTSSREGPDIRECYRLGANAYVVKPVDSIEFFKAITLLGLFWGFTNEAPVFHEDEA